MRALTIAVLGFSIVCGAAMAQTPAPSTPPADPAPPPPDNKELICVGQDPAASTRVHARRVCRTLEEWNKRGGVPK